MVKAGGLEMRRRVVKGRMPTGAERTGKGRRPRGGLRGLKGGLQESLNGLGWRASPPAPA